MLIAWPEWILLGVILLVYSLGLNHYGFICLPEEWLHLLAIKGLQLGGTPDVPVMHEGSIRLSSPLLVVIHQWFSWLFGIHLWSSRFINLVFGLIALAQVYLLTLEWTNNRRIAFLAMGFLGTFSGFMVGMQGVNIELPFAVLATTLVWLLWRWFLQTHQFKDTNAASQWIPPMVGVVMACLAWLAGWGGFIFPLALFATLLWQLSSFGRLGQFPRLFLHQTFWFALMLTLGGIGFYCFIASPALAQLAMKIWQAHYWVFWRHPWFIGLSTLWKNMGNQWWQPLLTGALWLFPWTFFMIGPIRALTSRLSGGRVMDTDNAYIRFLMGWALASLILFLMNPLLILAPFSILLAIYWVNSLTEARATFQFEWIGILTLLFVLILTVLGVRYGLQDSFNLLMADPTQTFLGLPGVISFPFIKWTVTFPLWQLLLIPSLTILIGLIIVLVVVLFSSLYRILPESMMVLTLLLYVANQQLLSPLFAAAAGQQIAQQLTTEIHKKSPQTPKVEIRIWQTPDHELVPPIGQFLFHLPTPLVQQVMVYPHWAFPKPYTGKAPLYVVVDEDTYFSWSAEQRSVYRLVKSAPYWWYHQPLLNLPSWHHGTGRWEKQLLLLEKHPETVVDTEDDNISTR